MNIQSIDIELIAAGEIIQAETDAELEAIINSLKGEN